MIRRRWLLCLLVAIPVLVFGTACNKRGATTDTSLGKTLPVPESKAESGWPVYDVPAQGFALALPPGWRQFDMNPKTFEAKFKEAIKQNPQLESMKGSLQQQITAGCKFMGIDQATVGTGFATNVNVLRLLLPPGATLDMAAVETLSQLEIQPNVIKPIAHERLKMTTGDRERFRYRTTMMLPSGQKATLAITQFVLLKDKDGYVVTLTTLPENEAKYAPTFDKIGESFRLTK